MCCHSHMHVFRTEDCRGRRQRSSDPLERMTGSLVVLVTYVLHADGVVVAVVLSVVQHNISRVDVRERMTTSINGRQIHVLMWSFESRGCAEKYQPITKELSLGSRGCARRTVAGRKIDGQHLLHLQLTRCLIVV